MAELGAIMGHEAGPLPPYDELFESGRGFTDPVQAKRFVEETNVDWLSIAIGNIHGAISAARKSEKKIEARLDVNRLDEIREAVGIPLVLHGGTGISKDYIIKSIQHGIAKVNVATYLSQAFTYALFDHLKANPDLEDPRVHLVPAREAAKERVRERPHVYIIADGYRGDAVLAQNIVIP